MTRAARHVLVALVLGSGLGCSAGVPTRSDVADIAAEARGTKSPPMFDSEARRAVRESIRHLMEVDKQYEGQVGKLFGRPELRSYLMLPESFIGGTFPKRTADSLREVEKLDRDYLLETEGFRDLLRLKLASAGLSEDERRKLEDDMVALVEAERRPVMEATEAHLHFVKEAARLYEMVAARPEALKAMRTGLEISDEGLHAMFNEQVDVVNAANDAAEAALQKLDAEQKARRSVAATKRAP